MQYNVAQLLKEPTGSTRSHGLSRESTNQSGVVVADLAGVEVEGIVQLLRTHQGILVRGSVDAWISMTCSRCLVEIVDSFRLVLEEEFFPVVDVRTGQRIDLPSVAEGTTGDPSATDGTIIDSNHVLDLTEVVRQYVIAAQPIKSLCRTDCCGLCPECGANLNSEECICGEEPRDPRWDALAALLHESKI